MQIKFLTERDIAQIEELYRDIKENSITFWDKDYPSTQLIKYDIERKGLWGAFEGDELVGICFAGERCEDNERGFEWKENFARRGTFARFGVAPHCQNKGIGSRLISFVLDKLREENFDGVRILVECDNQKAIKLYSKFKFNNCGKTTRGSHDYYLLELRLAQTFSETI